MSDFTRIELTQKLKDMSEHIDKLEFVNNNDTLLFHYINEAMKSAIQHLNSDKVGIVKLREHN